MSSYNYGPPPPPPPTAASAASTTYPYSHQYPQASRGAHSSRGGRGGGPDRAGYHPPAATYGYGQQPPYTQHPPAPSYAGPHPPQPAAYPPQPAQQQQWHHDQHAQQQQQQQHAQSSVSHAPLAAQNYHPNYAPQLYQQQSQSPYAGQPAYSPAPQPPYAQGYPSAAPQPAPQPQPWGSHPQPQGQPAYSSGTRGGRGGYNDRGGSKAPVMGQPIRLGFDAHHPGSQAPVSAPYPPQPYAGHPAAAYPPPQPYSPYPPSTPYAPPPHYDSHSGAHNNRHQYRNGMNSKPRGHFGGDKMRNRNHRGPNAQTPPTHHQKPDAASAGKKKKRKTMPLGLIPGDESDSDYENEEQRLEELIGADAPNPTGSTEVAKWIEERRKNFPTEKQREARKAAAAAAKGQNNRASSLEKEEQKVERLRRELRKAESKFKRKREQQDEGDEMRDVDASSPSSDGAKSDDEKPEVMSTRHEPSSVPPPTKKADPTKHCKYYSTGGTCGKRGKCRFVHDPAVREAALKEREENGGRLTLEQRLQLNDKNEEDMAIVKSLQYLKERNVLQRWGAPKVQNDVASNAAQDQPPATTQSSSLPPAPVKLEPGNGLPPIPPASVIPQVKYPGWDLSGFGNTGLQSGDV
ncbi:hypothetical protein V8F06_002117 [Rhypophila decipiens]